MSNLFAPNSELLKASLHVVGSVIAIALVSNWGGGSSKRFHRPQARTINALVKSAKRYRKQSTQDKDIGVRIAHISMALAFAQATKLCASRENILKLADVDIDEFLYALEQGQQDAIESY